MTESEMSGGHKFSEIELLIWEEAYPIAWGALFTLPGARRDLGMADGRELLTPEQWAKLNPAIERAKEILKQDRTLVDIALERLSHSSILADEPERLLRLCMGRLQEWVESGKANVPLDAYELAALGYQCALQVNKEA